MQPRVLIVGGSMAGLMAAGLFRAAGWQATLFERTRGDLTGRGAGLGISLELLKVMKRVDARFDPSIGVVHQSWVWLAADGKPVFELAKPSMGSAWSRVYQALRQTIPAEIYRAGMNVERVEQDGSGVAAIFADGSRAEGDLLVAADGILSTVRAQFLPEIRPRYAGYVGWRGIVAERDLPRETQDLIAGRIVACFPEGEMMLTMPVPGTGEDMRPGHRRCYFIWYRPADEAALADLFTDAAGRHHGAAIPPPLIRPEFIRAMKAHAAAVFAPPVAAVVERTAQPLLQAITDLECPRLVFGRVVLTGDAGFVARPHVAAGVTKAALDAECLVDSLASSGGDIAAGLAAYERSQLDFGRRLVAYSRYLGAYLEAQTRPDAPAAELSRDPARIICEYGAPHLIHDLTPENLRALRV
jgi:2-polyprenyl-6-methoxyphenol hydroxylase-like FAD-dependent oxidoreductase